MSWTPPDLGPGSYPDGAQLEEITDQIVALSAGSSDWSSTLTLTNLTVGNGALVARYMQAGARVDYRFQLTLGTTSAVGTSPRFTLPVTPVAGYANFPLGDVDLTDPGTANRRGMIKFVSGSTVEIVGYNTSGVGVTVSATVPHTWGTGDIISCVGTYEAA